MAQQSWLTDAYTASKTRPASFAPPPVAGAGTQPSTISPAMSMTPTAPAPKSPAGAIPPGAGYMRSFLAALNHAHSADMNGDGIPDSSAQPVAQPAPSAGTPTLAGTMPRSFGTYVPPRLGAPPPASVQSPPHLTPVPPVHGPGAATTAPPRPGTPGYVGPGPVVGTGSYPTGYDSPANAYAAAADQMNRAKTYDPFYSAAPAYAGNAWLSYILADPYNRMITDAGERTALDATNTAFDAARGRMRSDALESGAGESGVAAGRSKGLELARGNAQAANVRDFEKFKTEKGDERLKSLLMPFLSQENAYLGNSAPPTGDSKSDQYLQYALQVASLFA